MFKVPAKDILDVARVIGEIKERYPDHEELYVTVDDEYICIREGWSIGYGARRYGKVES